MDIAKFNKELGTKIAIARSLEKSDEITAAIKIWVEVSEMTLRFSKSRNLDFSFRNMLIKKTEGIVQHIKNLKSGKTIEDISVEEIEPFIEEIQDQETTEVISSEELKPKESFNEEFLPFDEKGSNAVESKDVKFVEDTEFKNIPDGFKEIHPNEDFKIITPHDDGYVEKILKKDIDMSIFNQKKEEIGQTQNQVNIKLEQPKDGTKVICFACGAELPAKTKICPDCGSTIN
ncbi:MAG: hypothetical protein ACFE8L_07445 [Candidatus Hodarchaeota archaeon]